MKVSIVRMKEDCKICKGSETCRYLVVGGKGFECMKHTSLAKTLDCRVEAGQMTARGDNCDGKENDDEPV